MIRPLIGSEPMRGFFVWVWQMLITPNKHNEWIGQQDNSNK